MKAKISGTYTAIITPFNKDFSVDLGGLKENICFQIENGVDGIIVLGSTGENATLSSHEKEKILEVAFLECKGKIHLMVGTGSNCTKTTIDNTAFAKKMGADSALVVAPYYNKPTQKGLVEHYSTIANAVDLDIVIYNIQGRTAVNIQTETLQKLASVQNIIGVKEASGNIFQMMDVIHEILKVRPDFSIMSGDDLLCLPLIALGGHGVYSVLSNVMPYQVKQMVDFALSHKFEEAKEMHYRLLPLMKDLFIEPFIVREKGSATRYFMENYLKEEKSVNISLKR